MVGVEGKAALKEIDGEPELGWRRRCCARWGRVEESEGEERRCGEARVIVL
jgi:hypothetical protein